MKYFFSLTLVCICFFSNAQGFLKSEITNQNGSTYSISLGVTATFESNGRAEVYNIKVDGTLDNSSKFISEDISNFFISTVINEELKFIAEKTGKTYQSCVYSSKVDPNNIQLEFKLTMKPDRVIVKANRIGGNLPEIPDKEFLYSTYMR